MPIFYKFVIHGFAFVKLFCTYWYDHIVWLFNLLMWCIILFGIYRYCKTLASLEINPNWSWCIIILMCFWTQFDSFVKVFCVYIHQLHWFLIFFFVVTMHLDLLSGLTWPHRMSLSYSADFWRSFIRIHLKSPVNVWQNNLMKHLVLDFGLMVFFIPSFNISTCDWSILVFCFLLVCDLEGYFCKKSSISSSLFILLLLLLLVVS